MSSGKRPSALAIHSVNRFVLSVPEISKANHFYTNFGLDVRQINNRLELYTFGHPHCWAHVYQSDKPKKLEYLSLGIYSEDKDAMLEHIRSKGYVLTDPHPMGLEEGFWLKDPEGISVQVIVAPKVSPSERTIPQGFVTKKNPIGIPIAPMRRDTSQVRPIRLSHLLMFTSDVNRSLAFYSGILGLRLSDHSGEGIAFAHGAHTSDHHLLAFAKSHGPGLHHSSWVVDHLDDVGLGMEQMRAAGYNEGWGLGRHVIGSNFFYYARDPWGSFAEFSYDIDFIDSKTEWPTADYPAEDSNNLWGPAEPSYFITNLENLSSV